MRALVKLAALAVVSSVLTGCPAVHLQDGRQVLRERVIENLQNGEIKVSENGIAILPSELSHASLGGEIYTSRAENGQLRVAFKTWQGKGRNMIGFLFVSRPLVGDEIQSDYYGNRVVKVGPIEVSLGKKIGANWYSASYQLD